MVSPQTRDSVRFPNDPTGDQLWELAVAGDPLTEAREVTFTIDFPTLTSVAVFIADLDEVLPERLQDRIAEQTLDVTISMVPNHEALQSVEAELEDLAIDNGGELMGWGMVHVDPPHPGAG